MTTPQAPPPVDPYQGRLRDMAALVARELPPVPWRTQPIAADGTLTMLTGRAGTGKTWVLHELANAVVRGEPAAGFGAAGGAALILDAEMGEYLTVQRFQEQGYSPQIRVFDAMGLDLKKPEARQLIKQVAVDIIGTAGGGFIGIDSLRRLCPSAKENDSDDMAGVVSWFAWLMREVNGAGVLVHHEGWEAGRARGSSSTVDQADAAWSMHPASDDEADRTMRITCGGRGHKPPRYCAPPAPLFVRIGTTGGLEAADAPVPKTESYRDAILAAAQAAEHPTNTALAEACGTYSGNSTWAVAFKALRDAGEIIKHRGVWAIPDDSDQPAI